MKRPVSEETGKAAQTASDIVSQGIQFAIMGNKSDEKHRMDAATYVACVGVSGGIHLLASLTGRCKVGDLDECKNDNKHSPLEHINPTSIMFAAILTAVAASNPIETGLAAEEGRNAGFEFEFGPDVIIQALELTEKVMGHKPDKFLNKKMVGTVREIESRAANPLGKFLAQKPSSPSTPTA